MEENQHASSYKEVSAELGKKLVKLYGEKIFPRQGKVFADMLFQTGVEAGTYITSLADVSERNVKVDLATHAMIKLNQTLYIINVMKEANYYTPAQVGEIENYIEELLRAMRNLLSAAFSQSRVETIRSVHVSKPAPSVTIHMPKQSAPKLQPAPKPAAKPAPAPAPAPKPAAPAKPAAPKGPQQPFDPDGFSDPVE